MGVKQTQFAYDTEWGDRKDKTKKTWKQIMEMGIIAAEAELGVVYVGAKKDSPEDPEEEVIPEGSFEIKISPDNGVEREFDVYEDDMWQTVNAFSDVKEGEIFRIRDINEGESSVIKINGSRCFSYEGLPYKNERGHKLASCIARAI